MSDTQMINTIISKLAEVEEARRKGLQEVFTLYNNFHPNDPNNIRKVRGMKE